MISLKTAILVSIIHLMYYGYFQLLSDIIRRGRVHNTPNIIIDRLRTKYFVNIRTFQNNTKQYGFAWFKVVYLNEKLFKKEKLLKWVFHHEHYHLLKKHKLKTLLMRGFFALLPISMAFAHWVFFAMAYMAWAYFMQYMHQVFEENANTHANKEMRSKKLKRKTESE